MTDMVPEERLYRMIVAGSFPGVSTTRNFLSGLASENVWAGRIPGKKKKKIIIQNLCITNVW
jgi:hypothetical protein